MQHSLQKQEDGELDLPAPSAPNVSSVTFAQAGTWARQAQRLQWRGCTYSLDGMEAGRSAVKNANRRRLMAATHGR